MDRSQLSSDKLERIRDYERLRKREYRHRTGENMSYYRKNRETILEKARIKWRKRHQHMECPPMADIPNASFEVVFD